MYISEFFVDFFHAFFYKAVFWKLIFAVEYLFSDYVKMYAGLSTGNLTESIMSKRVDTIGNVSGHLNVVHNVE